MLSAEREKQVLCDQYLRRENGDALLMLSKTLCMACDAGQTAGSVLSRVILDVKVEVEGTQISQMWAGSPGELGEARAPALSCAPGSPSAPLPKLATCRCLETLVATRIGKEHLEGR